VSIRHYQPGDESAQVEVYNTAAAALPRFKAATLPEVQRRTTARGFDPATRWYAEDGGRVVGYATFSPNGRVSYPWCLPGHERHAEPLFEVVLRTMGERGLRTAFTAYRSDWPTIHDFFLRRGFAQVREMVNFLLDFHDLPTATSRPANPISALTPQDVPAVLALGGGVLRLTDPAALHAWLFENPYFPPQALFALRSRQDNAPAAVGILVADPRYPDARGVDADMPCFRLGAFGTEGMTTKRVRGLFSFLARPDRSLFALGMDLLGQAAARLEEDDDLPCFAAQVASDAQGLFSFYRQCFQRQGSFPVFERALATP
jgi:hypothetical protein